MPKNHAQRSLGMYKLEFNRRGLPDETEKINDLDGYHIEDLFAGFCDEYQEQLLPSKSRRRFIKIHNHEYARGGILCSLHSGSSGEAFDVVDTESSRTVTSYDETMASMIKSRCFLKADYSPTYALYCVEHVTNGAGDTILFDPFRRYLSKVIPDIVLRNPEPVVEASTLDHFVSVEKVEIKKYLTPTDMTDELMSGADCITLSLTHLRNHSFPLALARTLLEDRGRITTLFGLQSTTFDPERDPVNMTLKDKSGVTRTFSLDDSLGMKFREVLNEGEAPPLDDDSFLEVCLKSCNTIEEYLGRGV